MLHQRQPSPESDSTYLQCIAALLYTIVTAVCIRPHLGQHRNTEHHKRITYAMHHTTLCCTIYHIIPHHLSVATICMLYETIAMYAILFDKRWYYSAIVVIRWYLWVWSGKLWLHCNIDGCYWPTTKRYANDCYANRTYCNIIFNNIAQPRCGWISQ